MIFRRHTWGWGRVFWWVALKLLNSLPRHVCLAPSPFSNSGELNLLCSALPPVSQQGSTVEETWVVRNRDEVRMGHLLRSHPPFPSLTYIISKKDFYLSVLDWPSPPEHAAQAQYKLLQVSRAMCYRAAGDMIGQKVAINLMQFPMGPRALGFPGQWLARQEALHGIYRCAEPSQKCTWSYFKA